MATITNSKLFTLEKILIGSFLEKMNAKSLFSVLVIVIECGQRQKKMMKKPLLHCYPFQVKQQICMGNAKIEKLKTWPPSKIIIDQGHILGNANFSPGRQICYFTLIQCFFLRLKMTIVFFSNKRREHLSKIIVKAYMKRNGIYVI